MSGSTRTANGLHILLVGKDARYRERLFRDLGRYRSHLSILHIEDPDQLDQALAQRTPDVLLLDDPWCDGQGLELLESLKQACPDLRCLLVTPPGNETVLKRCLTWGLDGHLLKTARHQALLAPAIEALVSLPSPPALEADEGSRVLMNRLNFGTFRATPDGHLVDGSPMLLRVLRLTSWERLADVRLSELFPQQDQREKYLAEVQARGSFFAPKLELQRSDESRTLASLTSILSQGTANETLIVGCLEEHPPELEQQPAASTCQTGWRLAQKELSAVAWTTDNDLLITALEGAGLESLQLDAEQFLGHALADLLEGQDPASGLLAAHRRALAGSSMTLDHCWKGRSLKMQVEPLRTEDDRILGCVCVALDVSQQRRVEQELASSEERYRQLFEDDLTADFSATPQGRILACNPAFARLFGADTVQEAQEQSLVECFPNAEAFRSMCARLEQLGTLNLEQLTLQRRDGAPLQVIANLVGRCEADGGLVEIKGYLCDDSERHSLQVQLESAQRLEAVGRLAGGVAHDFNNILTAINGYASLLLRQATPGSPVERRAAAIRKAGEQAAALTQQLMAFSRRQILESQVFSMNAAITDMRDMLRHLMRDDIELVIQPSSQPVPVQADRSQVEQIVLNLVLNARDAIPQGGRIEISISGAELDEAAAQKIAGMSPGRYILTTFRDNGQGMDAATRERIFEPFFTTKQEGKGLGLASAFNILTRSGGGIHCTSAPERGTTFHLYLPRGESEGLGIASPEPPRPRPRRATILVAEDDDNVRNLCQQILAPEGYEVILAATGREAVRKTRERKGPIHLLLADVFMPDFGGRDLVEILAGMRPEIVTLYMSAQPDVAMGKRAIMTHGSGFLQKPFTPDQLLARVASLLEPQQADEFSSEA